MSSQSESPRITVNSDQTRKAFLLDPETASFSYLHEMVKNKVRSVENTTIYMEYKNAYVFVDPVRLHEINLLPQQEKVRAIKQITDNIARSGQVLIYSQIAKDDL